MDKRCGTCKWWKPVRKHAMRGTCNYPLPALPEAVETIQQQTTALPSAGWVYLIDNDRGTDCPTWEAKP